MLGEIRNPFSVRVRVILSTAGVPVAEPLVQQRGLTVLEGQFGQKSQAFAGSQPA